jgi:uncharacterized protein with FMN-binding domain
MNKSSITKYIVGGIIVVAFVIYVVFANKSSMPTTATTTAVANNSSTTTTDNTPSTTATGTPTSGSGTTASSAPYKDGTYTGSVADAFYGSLQVSATITGGKITDVEFLQAPSDGHSGDVSTMAEPVLKQEAITAQSANVATVSGATQDTTAFQSSLAVALAKAQN